MSPSTLEAGAPLHLRFSSAAGEHLLVSAHSRLFDLPRDSGPIEAGDLAEALRHLEAAVGDEDALGAIATPPPQSLSLNVSAACNLRCGYCYAGQGGFGGAQPKAMSWPVAKAAVDRLLAGADRGAPVTIGFLGGEPFANRPLIHRVVEYARERARALGLDVRYSVTTNATLLREADLALLRSHPFAVVVSLDGEREVHDAQRPNARGQGSWDQAVRAIRPLLADPGRAKIAARVTVQRAQLRLREGLEALAGVGFEEVGFSPLRAGPDTPGRMRDEDWPAYLRALIALADHEVGRLEKGAPLRLTNLAVALKQIHRGASSPYPCGAGGGYFSVAHDGAWYACHRAIGDDRYRLGDNRGLDEGRRADFLRSRHVHAQSDCRTCWAKYLCSGGCHHEAGARTGAACDFIRGWLEYCLKTYCELGGAGLEGDVNA